MIRRCISHSFWSDNLGLCYATGLWRDSMFYAALFAAPVLLLIGVVLFSDSVPVLEFSWLSLFVLVVWQPIFEEMFFRGLLHGQLNKYAGFSRMLLGVTITNIVVSLLFTAAHLFVHSWGWVLAVFVPSLIFGWFRDRYSSIYPSVVLHSFYNAIFLIFVTYFCK